MNTGVYEQWLEESKLAHLKAREQNEGLDTRSNWYELGFFDGWRAAITQKEADTKKQ